MNNIDAIKLQEIKKLEARLFNLIESYHEIGDKLKPIERERLLKQIESVKFLYSTICL